MSSNPPSTATPSRPADTTTTTTTTTAGGDAGTVGTMPSPPPNASAASSSLYANYPLKDIQAPHPHDVLCGRGGGTNAHIGNSHWRMLVSANKELYVTLPKRQKMLLSKSIVNAVRSQQPPGRFLQKNNKTDLWYDVGDQRAQEKTSQALREGAPDIRSKLSNDTDDPSATNTNDEQQSVTSKTSKSKNVSPKEAKKKPAVSPSASKVSGKNIVVLPPPVVVGVKGGALPVPITVPIPPPVALPPPVPPQGPVPERKPRNSKQQRASSVKSSDSVNSGGRGGEGSSSAMDDGRDTNNNDMSMNPTSNTNSSRASSQSRNSSVTSSNSPIHKKEVRGKKLVNHSKRRNSRDEDDNDDGFDDTPLNPNADADEIVDTPLDPNQQSQGLDDDDDAVAAMEPPTPLDAENVFSFGSIAMTDMEHAKLLNQNGCSFGDASMMSYNQAQQPAPPYEQQHRYPNHYTPPQQQQPHPHPLYHGGGMVVGPNDHPSNPSYPYPSHPHTSPQPQPHAPQGYAAYQQQPYGRVAPGVRGHGNYAPLQQPHPHPYQHQQQQQEQYHRQYQQQLQHQQQQQYRQYRDQHTLPPMQQRRGNNHHNRRDNIDNHHDDDHEPLPANHHGGGVVAPVDGGLEPAGLSFGSVMSISTDIPSVNEIKLEGGPGLSFGSMMSYRTTGTMGTTSIRGNSGGIGTGGPPIAQPVDGGLEAIGTSFGSLSLATTDRENLEQSILQLEHGHPNQQQYPYGKPSQSSQKEQDREKDRKIFEAAPTFLSQQKSRGSLLECSDTDSEDECDQDRSAKISYQKSLEWEKLKATLAKQTSGGGGGGGSGNNSGIGPPTNNSFPRMRSDADRNEVNNNMYHHYPGQHEHAMMPPPSTKQPVMAGPPPPAAHGMPGMMPNHHDHSQPQYMQYQNHSGQYAAASHDMAHNVPGGGDDFGPGSSFEIPTTQFESNFSTLSAISIGDDFGGNDLLYGDEKIMPPSDEYNNNTADDDDDNLRDTFEMPPPPPAPMQKQDSDQWEQIPPHLMMMQPPPQQPQQQQHTRATAHHAYGGSHTYR